MTNFGHQISPIYVYFHRSFGPKHTCQQGHSYCKRNPALEDIAGLIPLDLNRIPDIIQVAFLSWKKGDDSIEHQISSSECFKVRGKYCLTLVYRLLDVSLLNHNIPKNLCSDLS